MSIEREPSSTGLLFKLAAPYLSVCSLRPASRPRAAQTSQPPLPHPRLPMPLVIGARVRRPAQRRRAESYRILPNDMLDVSVYQVPALNRTAQVDGTGHIALPLIGGVKAGGRTARELEADIAAKLGAKYLNSPQVTVLSKMLLGQRVTIDGAVRKPGVYSANTLLQSTGASWGRG